MPPVLSDYTYAIGETGFILNSDFNGKFPFVDIDSITGLDSAPTRLNTTEREGMDGTYVDALFSSMRTVVITGTAYANVYDVDTICDILRAQYSSSITQPFYFKHPGKPIRFVLGQGGGAQYNVDTLRRVGQTAIQMTILCSDPYIYDYPANFSSAVTAAPSVSGLGFNVSFNTGFGAAITPVTVAVTNSGTRTAFPIIQLFGPLTNPTLTDSVSNISMRINRTLLSTDNIIVDCRNKAITLNSTNGIRSSYKGLNFFSVPAGVSDTFYLHTDAVGGSYSVTLYNTYY